MNNVERLIRSPLGAVIARPWFDGFALGFFNRWFFPLSRMWAAARAAHGSAERFYAEVPITVNSHGGSRLDCVLTEFETRRAMAAAAEAEWESAFFGDKEKSVKHLAEVEKKRLDCRARYNNMRRKFAYLRRGNAIPPIRWELLSPMQAAADYAKAIRHPEELFAPPATMPAVQVSESFTDDAGRHYWLRFQSPSVRMADTVTARVQEPRDTEKPTTVIFLHGICVEFDHWHGMLDDVAELVRNGIRTIRVEAPWHGRRVADGRYGGEKFVGTMPLGSLEYFSAQVREIAVLLDWCRQRWTSPLALAGSSLGAHVSRLLATCAREWHTSLQPDALLLITPCERIEEAAIDGAFADVWEAAEKSVRIGWTPILRDKFFGLLDPLEPPCVPPERIVAVLGTLDRVTPYHSGRRLVDRLEVPEENIFTRQLGHFGIPMNLVRDRAPLLRFCELLDGSHGRF